MGAREIQTVRSNLFYQRIFQKANIVGRNESLKAYGEVSVKETLDCPDRLRLQADPATLASILRTCGNAEALSKGNHIHEYLVKIGHEQHPLLGNLLVQMYGKCKALEEALTLLASMHKRDVFSWNFIIRAHAQLGKCNETIDLFDRMQKEGILPDRVTVVSVLAACCSHAMLVQGRWVHTIILISGFEVDNLVGTALVNTYGKCGSIEDAERTFDKIPERDVITWTAIITVYVQHGQGTKALQLVDQMQQRGLAPDKVTVVSILDACARHAWLAQGMWIHAHVLDKGIEVDIILGTALVNMYGTCGSLDDAQQIFNNMRPRNMHSWTVMIGVYVRHRQCKEAFELFDLMHQEGYMPDKVTFVNVLDACENESALTQARQVHDCILVSGFESNVVVGTALVKAYGKCVSLADAWKAFDGILRPDVITWNTMIEVLSQNGKREEVGQCFCQMQQEGAVPNKFTFIGMLTVCGSHAMLTQGRQMHACILQSGVELDEVMGTALVDMYAKCDSLDYARWIFDSMFEQDVLSWNTMISSYAQHGHCKESLHLFGQMKQTALLPDKVTIVTVFAAMASLGVLTEGRRVHACIVAMESKSDFVVGNALLNFYGNCGCFRSANRIFTDMPQRDLVAWTSMIAMYSRHGASKEAFQLFHQMLQETVLPDKVTYVCLITSCSDCAELAEGQQVHACIYHCGFKSDPVVGTAIVNMYGKCGNIEAAWKMFNGLLERDMFLWNAMIAVCSHHGQSKEAIQLFHEMVGEGFRPDKLAFASILSVCASHQPRLLEAKQMHAQILDSQIESDVAVGSSILNTYGKCGSVEDSKATFDEMSEKNIVCWNAMLAVYAQHGKGIEALQLFHKMQQEGTKPDTVTFINTLAACSHSGLIEEAHDCFASMYEVHGILPVVDHYVCMIDILKRAGQLDEAERLTHHMPLQPTVVPFTALLGACRHTRNAQQGKCVTSYVLELDSKTTVPTELLSNIYTAAGNKKNALNA